MLKFLVVPVISALIGYITNVVAVQMLFRPRRPVRILGITLQGLLPRRQAEIARSLGEVVERELLSLSDLLDQVNTPQMQETLVNAVVGMVRQRLSEVVPKFVPGNLTRLLGDALESVLAREAPHIINAAIEQGRERLLADVNIAAMVEGKINQYDVSELEGLIKSVSIKELTYIEVLGGVLGLVIGILQDIVVFLLP